MYTFVIFKMKIEIPIAYSYDDVLLVPQKSSVESRNDIDLSINITPRLKIGLPILSANMSDVTGVETAIALGKLGGIAVLPRFMTDDDEVEMVIKVKKAGVKVGAAVGIRENPIERTEKLLKAGADLIVLDVAHGHMDKVLSTIKMLKDHFGDKINLIGGNVATAEAAEDLFIAGADGVKVGIGPGSICTTRIQTGSGVPQITAIMEAARIARKYNKYIIADGGAKNSGDIVKALAAGASAIMAGFLFAGTKEAPGELKKINGKMFKVYNGSTSEAEKIKHMVRLGKLPDNYVKQIEGTESVVPYKGELKDNIEHMMSNVRSGLSYSGAKNIPELWKRAKFVRVTPLGSRENGSHDVIAK